MNQHFFKIVVLSGGYGSRLLPWSRYLPKGLIPFGGIPILFHTLCFAQEQLHYGQPFFLMNICYLKEKLVAELENWSTQEWGIKIFSNEIYPMDWGGAIGQMVSDLASERYFGIMNGDLVAFSLSPVKKIWPYLMNMTQERDYDLVLATSSRFPEGVNRGIRIGPQDVFRGICSPFSIDSCHRCEHFLGIALAKSSILGYFEGPLRSLTLFGDLIPKMMKNGQKVAVLNVDPVLVFEVGIYELFFQQELRFLWFLKRHFLIESIYLNRWAKWIKIAKKTFQKRITS